MRNTKQKELIFKIVNFSYDHLCAQDVYNIARKEIPNISLGTVYRILNELVSNHQILRITTESGIDHYDRIPQEKHSHFICSKCGKIIDIFKCKCSLDNDELKKYDVDSYEVIIKGLCNDCKGKE